MKTKWQNSELAKTHEKMKADYDRLDHLENKVKELEAQLHCVYEGAAQWEQEYDDCRSILQKLVDLKVIKDTDGKTPYYLENQPLAWKQAKEFLKKYQHQIS